MFIFIYDPKEEESFTLNVLPSFVNSPKKHIPFSKDFKKIQPKSHHTYILYLDDRDTASILPKLSESSASVGILPHPKSKFIFSNFRISPVLQEAIEDIQADSKPIKMDLLLCNGKPVLHSVNIGDMFTIRSSLGNYSFLQKLKILVGKFRMLFSLRHTPYKIISNDNKEFDTCALGIVAVEHASSSFITKKLVPSTNLNDGMLHAIIVSPRSVLELFRFLFKNLFPEYIRSSSLPEFISHIKNPCLRIQNPQGIDYEADGISYSAKEVVLEVLPANLPLIPGRKAPKQEEVSIGKSTYRTTNLPKGETRQELITQELPFLYRASTEDFKELFIVLRENAHSSPAYLTMMVLSTILACLGLFSNSSPVIIGAMILAPLMAPIISLSMAVLRMEEGMLKNSLITIAKGTFLSLGFAALLALSMPIENITDEIGARTKPTILDLGIAIVSGIAGAFAHAKEGIAKSLAGVAIAVALVPPLAVAGVGIGWLDWRVFWGAFLLYTTNLAGIVMAGSITFLILGFSPYAKAHRGLGITFLLVILVSVPLSLSFFDLKTRVDIEKELTGLKLRQITIKDVKVQEIEPTRISIRLVSFYPVTDKDLDEIKKKIRKKLDRPVTVEFITSIIR